MTTCFGKALKFWLGAAGSLALSISVACAEDKVIELKLSDWVPASHPLNKSLEEWGASVEKASNGTIKYKMYPAQQLGKAFDHYDMARDGIADLTFVSPGYQPGRFPIIGAGDLPFMIRDAKGAARAFAEWYPKYAATEMKDVKLCFAFAQEPGTFHSRDKKIVVPEVRDVLEKGVVDGVNFPWNSVVLFGIDKVTKYHMDVPFYSTGLVWVMNKAVYESMSAAQKKVIDDHCNPDWSVRVTGPWSEFEHAGVAIIKGEAGHESYPLTDNQLAQWKKAGATLVADWHASVKKAGVDSEAALKDLQDLLTKYDAAF